MLPATEQALPMPCSTSPAEATPPGRRTPAAHTRVAAAAEKARERFMVSGLRSARGEGLRRSRELRRVGFCPNSTEPPAQTRFPWPDWILAPEAIPARPISYSVSDLSWLSMRHREPAVQRVRRGFLRRPSGRGAEGEHAQ